ncbi:hypothetical protein PVAND_014267 [Polypedilum vanderplanki]|uniref:Chitin-binding type-2 domain-containing protein n=1 Tax=Polypedilum vanderplanki TaxID=319348 RepID=A0A9J6CRU1_POLVA|nr:hypothetical protein PVAND_014267 [Polypedilum vanderplanki]
MEAFPKTKICPLTTYYDPIKDKCQKVPGGGEMIKINLDARCANGFLGLLPNSKKSRYYFVCNKHSVLTCMCRDDELFSKIRLKCENQKNIENEKLTHQVVENIFDKYKCKIMEKCTENGNCIKEQTTTMIYDFENLSKLKNLLKYLQIMKSIETNMKSYEESLEITTTQIPLIVDIPITNQVTSELTTTTENWQPKSEEIKVFNKIWPIQQITTISSNDMMVKWSLNEETTTIGTIGNGNVIGKSFDNENVTTTTTARTMLKRRKQKKKALETTTEFDLSEYYEYYYDDDPLKVIWIKDIVFGKNKSLEKLSTTTETIMKEIKSTVDFKNFETLTNFYDFIETTTLNVPAEIIFIKENNKNSIFDETKQKDVLGSKEEITTINNDFVSSNIFEREKITNQPQTTTVNLTSFEYQFETTTQNPDLKYIKYPSTTFEIDTTTNKLKFLNSFQQTLLENEKLLFSTTEQISTTEQLETTTDSFTSTTDNFSSRENKAESNTVIPENIIEYSTIKDITTTIQETTLDNDMSFMFQSNEKTSTIANQINNETTTEEIVSTTDRSYDYTTDSKKIQTSNDITTLPNTSIDFSITSDYSVEIISTTEQSIMREDKKIIDDDRVTHEIGKTKTSTEIENTKKHENNLEKSFSKEDKTNLNISTSTVETYNNRRVDVEYYYEYEEYEVDSLGIPIDKMNSNDNEKNFKSKEKKSEKNNHDISYEYSHESSASEEMKKVNREYFNYFY